MFSIFMRSSENMFLLLRSKYSNITHMFNTCESMGICWRDKNLEKGSSKNVKHVTDFLSHPYDFEETTICENHNFRLQALYFGNISKKKVFLPVVDIAIGFHTVAFLGSHGKNFGQSVKGTWFTSLLTWSLVNIWYPDRLQTDQ